MLENTTVVHTNQTNVHLKTPTLFIFTTNNVINLRGQCMMHTDIITIIQK